jgi:hypothetical protein
VGYGDVLSAAALAQELFDTAPWRGPVLIVNCDDVPRWRPEWDGHPAIMNPGRRDAVTAPRLRLGGGCLPYHPWTRETTWRARDHRAKVYLTREELKRGMGLRQRYGPYVLIEAPGTDRKNSNRCWPGWPRLAELLRARVDLPLLQLDRPQAVLLPGTIAVPHDGFRNALAILASATLAVLPEGGITIGAATVGTPAVVVWGGCGSVEAFGYPEHVNIVDDDPRTPCVSTKPCAHCRDAWDRLSPEHVADVVVSTLADLRAKSAEARP